MSKTPAAASAPLQFAYWVPNVSGGLVISDIEQRTGWDYDYNKRLAQTAENNGFEYALSFRRSVAPRRARLNDVDSCWNSAP